MEDGYPVEKNDTKLHESDLPEGTEGEKVGGNASFRIISTNCESTGQCN